MVVKKTDKEQTLDVEEELGNEDIQIDIPFNPNDININIVPRNIGQIVEMLQYDEILIPKFQRLPNLWDPKKKSRFIESLMLNLPIPLFYFDEGEDKKWRVIDGLQRISTLEHFILADQKDKTISGNKTSFKLQNLEFRTEFNGKSWAELPKDVQRRISTNQVTINLIGKGTPEEVKYNIFSRINQGGVELKPQEIRTALFQGYRIDFLESLVSNQTETGMSFLKATDNSVASKRQEDLDFVTRFISFFLLGHQKYEPDMDTFLTQGTKEEIPSDKKSQLRINTSFKAAMQLSFSLFRNDSFRKRLKKGDKRKPINKSLFEIISVNFARLSEIQQKSILLKKNEFLKDFTELQKSEKFSNSITTGTAAKERVKQRHEDFLSLLKKFK